MFHKIGMMGFLGSMSELICWCKEQGMAIGTARGSVGGSPCCLCDRHHRPQSRDVAHGIFTFL